MHLTKVKTMMPSNMNDSLRGIIQGENVHLKMDFFMTSTTPGFRLNEDFIHISDNQSVDE